MHPLFRGFHSCHVYNSLWDNTFNVILTDNGNMSIDCAIRIGYFLKYIATNYSLSSDIFGLFWAFRVLYTLKMHSYHVFIRKFKFNLSLLQEVSVTYTDRCLYHVIQHRFACNRVFINYLIVTDYFIPLSSNLLIRHNF